MSATTECAAIYDAGTYRAKHKNCAECDRYVQMVHGGPTTRLTFPAQIVPAATGSGEPTVERYEKLPGVYAYRTVQTGTCDVALCTLEKGHKGPCWITPPASQPTALDRITDFVWEQRFYIAEVVTSRENLRLALLRAAEQK